MSRTPLISCIIIFLNGGEKFFYEANPHLEKHIRENYKLNNVHPNLKFCILGETEGEKDFYIGQHFWGSSTLKWEAELPSVKVPEISFEYQIKKINPTFLLIDIEGGEYDLLKDINLVNFDNIKNIFIELHCWFLGQEKIDFLKAKFFEADFRINKDFSFELSDSDLQYDKDYPPETYWYTEELFLQR